MKPYIRCYEVVWEFERQVAEFAGAKYGVATDSCTSAIFLCCKYLNVGKVTLPARTYISAAAAVRHAGGSIVFEDYEWAGMYQLNPYPIWDAALRFRKGMYEGGYQCLSFQSRKLLPIGRGGMVLTDDQKAVDWLRKHRANGRDASVPYKDDRISVLGWNMAMIPEQAARGLQLMEAADPNAPDRKIDYPDLRQMPVFQ